MSSYNLDTLESLTEEMVERPGYYGISFYRENPCCDRDRLKVSFQNGVVGATFETAEDASKYLGAVTATVEHYRAKFAEDPLEFETGGPCISCLRKGDYDPKWAATVDVAELIAMWDLDEATS